MQTPNTWASENAGRHSRQSVFARVMLAPLEHYVPRWAWVSVVVLVSLIAPAVRICTARHSAQSWYDGCLTTYQKEATLTIQKDQTMQDVFVERIPRPSFWSDEPPHIAATGAVETGADYQRLIAILTDPYGAQKTGDAVQDLCRFDFINHAEEYKIVIDVEIRETGEQKHDTLIIPKAKSESENED